MCSSYTAFHCFHIFLLSNRPNHRRHHHHHHCYFILLPKLFVQKLESKALHSPNYTLVSNRHHHQYSNALQLVLTSNPNPTKTSAQQRSPTPSDTKSPAIALFGDVGGSGTFTTSDAGGVYKRTVQLSQQPGTTPSTVLQFVLSFGNSTSPAPSGVESFHSTMVADFDEQWAAAASRWEDRYVDLVCLTEII